MKRLLKAEKNLTCEEVERERLLEFENQEAELRALKPEMKSRFWLLPKQFAVRSQQKKRH